LKEAATVTPIDINETWNNSPHLSVPYAVRNAHLFTPNGRPNRTTPLSDIERMLATQDAELTARLTWSTTPDILKITDSELTTLSDTAYDYGSIRDTTKGGFKSAASLLPWQGVVRQTVQTLQSVQPSADKATQSTDEANQAASWLLNWSMGQHGGNDYDLCMEFVCDVMEQLQTTALFVFSMLPTQLLLREPALEQWKEWLLDQWKKLRARTRKANAKDPVAAPFTEGICSGLNPNDTGALPDGYKTEETIGNKNMHGAYHPGMKEMQKWKRVTPEKGRPFDRIPKSQNETRSKGVIKFPSDAFTREHLLVAMTERLCALEPEKRDELLPLFVGFLGKGLTWKQIASENGLKTADAARKRYRRALEAVAPEYLATLAAEEMERLEELERQGEPQEMEWFEQLEWAEMAVMA
jgi:hypothetical protein